MKKKYKIVFMGTPDFSVPPLKVLHESVHEVSLVVTQPDRPKGRGRKMMPPPVKEAAVKMGYRVIQPEKVNTDEFKAIMEQVKPDLFVVVAFGHILSQDILNIPRLGAINIHASLLPKYRGAAPIQWAVINGEKETGVTTMFMDRGMDTGHMLLKEKLEISTDDTAGSLHDRLAKAGADILSKTLKEFEQETIKPIPQDNSKATYARPLKKKDGLIDWNKPAETLECFIRGMTPWPGAFTFFNKKRLRIFKARPLDVKSTEAPGTILQSFPDELRVGAGDQSVLSILEIQGPSGKRLEIKDFLRGCQVPAGTILT